MTEGSGGISADSTPTVMTKSSSASRKAGKFVLSPKKRRSVLFGAAVPGLSRNSSMDSNHDVNFEDVHVNNDEAEKRERQIRQLQQHQQLRTVSSPAGGQIVDKRKSLGTSGLTSQQLADHYSKCIQLSAENKITMKNAFNLQLIDYMAEMLKRKDSDMNNFQVASCTLDASTKIYAYRVDSIHTDTLKIAGGLGRTSDKNNEDQEVGAGREGDELVVRKRKTKKKVIETNLKSLNCANFDLDFEVDPLFKKTAAQFDEGRGGGGQFLCSLSFLDDTCQLLLDSEIVLVDINSAHIEGMCDKVMLPDIADLTGKMVCPTFSSFSFCDWNLEMNDSFVNDIPKKNGAEEVAMGGDHMFDMNAVPEPIGDELDVDDDAFDDPGMDSIHDDNLDDGSVMTVGHDGCQAGVAHHRILVEAVHLKEHLASAPSEYSYFDPAVMLAWAGPGHWKLRPMSKDKRTEAHTEPRRRKENIILTFDDQDSLHKDFQVPKMATKLATATLKLWVKDKTTLPLDLHYDAADFFRLYDRPSTSIRRKGHECQSVDDSIHDYNYDNRNDRDNFCPDMAADNGDSEYDEPATPGYDLTDIFSQTCTSQPADAALADFMGDNLVSAPNKVAKINIGYARTAKKMDMKRLKMSMWSVLTDPISNKENENSADIRSIPLLEEKEHMEPGYHVHFSKMFTDLPRRLTSRMTENLSVSLAFIALLHLANERGLQFQSEGDLGDFVIMQGH